MRKETSSRKSPRNSSGSSAARPRHGRIEAPLGERLLDSMKELQAHLRGEIKLSETVYHVPPETDVRALRETLGLSQSNFAALFGFNVRSLQDWEQGRGARRSPSVPTSPSSSVTQRLSPCPACRLNHRPDPGWNGFGLLYAKSRLSACLSLPRARQPPCA